LFSAKEKRLLWSLACVQFCLVADFMVLSPMGPVLMRDFKVGPKELGWLITAYTFSAAIAGLVGSLFVDRFDRRVYLLTLLVLFGVGEIACALAPGYDALFICRLYCGACAGLAGAVLQTIAADVIAPERRGAAIGTVMTGFSLASVAGVPIGLFFASYFGWHAPFIFLTLCVVLVWVACRINIPSMSAHVSVHREAKGGLFRPLIEVVKNPNHIKAYGLVALLLFSSFMVIPFISVYAVANIHIPEKQLSLIYLMGGAATFFTSRYVGKLTDQLGARKMFQIMSVVAIASVLITTHLVPVPIWVVLLSSTLFFIVVPARMIPSMTMINAMAVPHMRGTFMSLLGAVQSTVQGLAALLATLIISRSSTGELQHYHWVGYCSVAFIIASLAWVAYFTKTVKTPVYP
jgi:predicted MFS family arabinose efflux permease